MAQYYQGLADNDANSHGVAIARLAVAESLAQDALRMANAVPHSIPANANLTSETGSTMVDIVRRHLSNVQDKMTEFGKDNEFIYHQPVPNEASLAVVPKLPAAKAIPVGELYAGQDISRIIGPDIFQRIVPMSVTESASLYDEEKAKLIRAESERVDVADGEMAASLDYLKLPGSLNVLKGGFDRDQPVVDDDFRRWCADLAGHDPFDAAFDQLKADRGEVHSALERCMRQLVMEESICERMRAKYGVDWTQQPSSRLTSTLRSDIRNYGVAVDEASASDAQLFSTFRQYETDFEEMRSAGETDEAEVLFQRAMVKVGATRAKQQQQQQQQQQRGRSGSPSAASANDPPEPSLLDEDYGEGGPSVADQIARVEKLLKTLQQVKRERAQVLKDLKEKVRDRPVSFTFVPPPSHLIFHLPRLVSECVVPVERTQPEWEEEKMKDPTGRNDRLTRPRSGASGASRRHLGRLDPQQEVHRQPGDAAVPSRAREVPTPPESAAAGKPQARLAAQRADGDVRHPPPRPTRARRAEQVREHRPPAQLGHGAIPQGVSGLQRPQRRSRQGAALLLGDEGDGRQPRAERRDLPQQPSARGRAAPRPDGARPGRRRRRPGRPRAGASARAHGAHVDGSVRDVALPVEAHRVATSTGHGDALPSQPALGGAPRTAAAGRAPSAPSPDLQRGAATTPTAPGVGALEPGARSVHPERLLRSTRAEPRAGLAAADAAVAAAPAPAPAVRGVAAVTRARRIRPVRLSVATHAAPFASVHPSRIRTAASSAGPSSAAAATPPPPPTATTTTTYVSGRRGCRWRVRRRRLRSESTPAARRSS